MESAGLGRRLVAGGIVVAAGLLVLAVAWLPGVLVTAPEPRTVDEILGASTGEGGEPISFEAAEAIRLEEESTHARDVSDTRRTVLAAGAGLVGLVLAGLTWWRTNTMQGQLDVARASQVTETFARAVEQLGTRPGDGSGLEVRLGGIYTLERIARDSETERFTVADVLAAFVRTHAGPVESQEGRTSQPVDVQAALKVIGRFDTHGNVLPFDLSSADLSGADLTGANLIDADLAHTDLTSANLFGAKLTNANLIGANLTSSNLGTDLTNADLTNANLTGANLTGADLTDVNLISADLTDAELWGANLTNVDLFGANLSGAKLTGAYLRDAKLGGSLRYDEETRWPKGFEPPPSY